MTRLNKLCKLNKLLLTEMPEYRQVAESFPQEEESQWRLFRSLVNLRTPAPASEEFLTLQDSLLQEEAERKGVTEIIDLTPMENNIYLWQGDITTLRCGAIVNAANSGMTGCYHPCHGCIDNAIHTYAGVQLRLECAELMAQQNHPEPTGQAKITKAYNLPCDHVIHTVGPIVMGGLTSQHEEQLHACYRSCLELVEQNGIKSIAFCCISTGEFHFPNHRAAEIAVNTVQQYLREIGSGIDVIFNVFKDADREIYEDLLNS